MKTWTKEEAKNSFDSLLENACHHEEQIIQLNNQQKVVVVSLDDYLKQKNKKPRLANWLLNNMRDIGELSLPNRKDSEREIPFQK